MNNRNRIVPKAAANLERDHATKILPQVGQALKQSAERNTPIGKTRNTIYSYTIRNYATMVRIGNTDPFMHLTEFGSKNNPAYAPLRRGAIALGLRLVLDPKNTTPKQQ